MKKYKISSTEFAEMIIVPGFQDLTPQAPLESSLFDWTAVDLKGKASQQIINIRRTGNILQRRDGGCELVYKKLMGTSIRKITAEELYAAVRQCGNAFYQGALKDFRAGNALFGSMILPFFQSAIRQDLVTNGYFGNTDSTPDPTSEFSTDKFDGVITWLTFYTSGGVIPANQAFSITNVNMKANPATAIAVLKSAIDRRPILMRNMAKGEQIFYVSQNLFDGVQEYYKTIGQSTMEIVYMYTNGVAIYKYDGIQLVVEPMFEPVLASLSGNTNACLCILTLRGNFNFAYDSYYGEGEDMRTALMIWYEEKDLSWYYQSFMKCGVQIALPEFIVWGITPY